MALAGLGAVAIWHDIAPEGRDAFYAWHGGEHMPERVAIPGFLRGRRYVALEGAPEYFNLYETTTTAVLTGAEYLARLNDPTPLTRATVTHFRNVTRGVCEVAASAGNGGGGLIATFRYTTPEAVAQADRGRWTARVEALAARPGIAGCHFLVADPAGSAIETAERKARAGTSGVPRSMVLVEGWGDVAPLVAWCRGFARSDAFAGAEGGPDWAVYRLQATRERAEGPVQAPRGVAHSGPTP